MIKKNKRSINKVSNTNSLQFTDIQCIPQKRKPINRFNFSENCNKLSEEAYIFTKFSLSSFFWHQLQDTCNISWPCMNKHWPFHIVMSKMICAEFVFKGLPCFRTKGHVERHSLVFLLSLLSCFFCLDSLCWHGLASLNLVILLNTIILRKSFLTCMSLNCSLSFIHWDIILCLISNDALDNEA